MDSQREHNGEDDSETSTHTAMALHVLNVGDMVKVKFNKVYFCFIAIFIKNANICCLGLRNPI